MAGIEEKITALETKLKQAKAQRQQIEARKRVAEAKTKRTEDTRRKILAGALVLEMMEGDDATKQRFLDRLGKYLTRTDDRALFNLSPLTDAQIKAPEPTKSEVPQQKVSGNY